MKWALAGSLSMLFAVAMISFCIGPVVHHSVAIGWGIPHGAALPLRLARIAAAAIVGAALSLSGVYLQNLLRNPLADPYVLGLSGGASLGVVIWIFLIAAVSHLVAIPQWILFLLSGGHTLPSLAGAGTAVAACFWLGRRGGAGFIDPVRLILAGVIISTIAGALMLLINSFLPMYDQNRVYFYLFGYISEITPLWLLAVGATVLVTAWVVGLLNACRLDIASLSDIEAASMGVSIRRMRLLSFVVSSALTAIAVAIAGPIGFVGLICPHIGRRLVGPTHRRLVIIAPILGATLLTAADLITRISELQLNHPIPVGVLTALIGGPLFLYLMRDRIGWR